MSHYFPLMEPDFRYLAARIELLDKPQFVLHTILKMRRESEMIQSIKVLEKMHKRGPERVPKVVPERARVKG